LNNLKKNPWLAVFHIFSPGNERHLFFSDESSEIEYSSPNEFSISVGDNLDMFCSYTTSSPRGLHEVVIIHLSSDEDENVDVNFGRSISY